MSEVHHVVSTPDGGGVAFCDLEIRGPRGEKLVRLLQDTECIVASPEGTRGIRFDWPVSSHEAIRPAPEGEHVRAFFGTRIRSDVLPKVYAAQASLSLTFFGSEWNCRGGSIIANAPSTRVW